VQAVADWARAVQDGALPSTTFDNVVSQRLGLIRAWLGRNSLSPTRPIDDKDASFCSAMRDTFTVLSAGRA
jgi:hypothetical protein